MGTWMGNQASFLCFDYCNDRENTKELESTTKEFLFLLRAVVILGRPGVRRWGSG
jgi:hypothetical protein